VSEDSLVAAFERRLSATLNAQVEYRLQSLDGIRGRFFPKAYVFYDDAHLLPVATIRYQYLDTARLRLEEREMDLGLPNVWRVGWGFVWDALDLQSVAGYLASEHAKRFVRSTAEAAKSNALLNFRRLLRAYVLTDSILAVIDSLDAGMREIEAVADSLRRLGRLPPKEYILLRMKGLRLEESRRMALRERERLRDTLKALLGFAVDDVEVSDEPLGECVPYDSTALVEAQRWRWRAASLWWMPKLLIFGEHFYGRPTSLSGSSGFGTLYGLRLVMLFDETARLKARRERAALLALRPERRPASPKRAVEDTDGELVEEARRLVEEAERMFRLGRLDIFSLYSLKREYYTLRLDALRRRIERLKDETCPVMMGR